MAITMMALSLAIGEHIVSDEREASDFWRRAIVIPQRQFDELTVTTLANTFLRDAAPFTAALLSVFVDDTDARIMLGKSALPVTYDSWLGEYSRYGRRRLPMAEVVVLRSGAVLRISDGKKETRGVVLRGEDPLRLGAPSNAEIVGIRLYRGAPLESGQFRKRSGAEVYVTDRSAMTEEEIKSVTELAAKRIGLEFAQIFVRRDVWFIDQASFPVDYRFDTSSPPSRDDYRSSRTWACLVERGPARCWLRKPTP
jgi:hypothetical protein